MAKIPAAAFWGGNMDENEYQKIIKENMRTSDMLFLEYAVKKCSLTMSKEDILAHTERLLRELAGEEDVYPKGAPVVSRRTDPSTLEIGDDITFMTGETTTVTHRIIGIVENYADTGQRAFQTQSVMNRTPDSQLVPGGQWGWEGGGPQSCRGHKRYI